MQKAPVKIPTGKDISSRWNGFSKIYSKHYAPGFLFKGQGMMKQVGVEKARNIVEVACGDGRLSTEIALKKPITSKFTAIDISAAMCNTTYLKLQKLENLVQKPFGIVNFEQKLENIESEADVVFESTKEIKGLNSYVSIGNNEDLQNILEDSSVDAYIASLSL